MQVHSFTVGPIDTNAYLIVVDGHALAIDPGQGAATVLITAAADLDATIDTVLNTHGHWDHVADNAALLREINVPLLIHAADAPMIETSEPQTFGFDLPWEPSRPTALLEEGSAVTLADLTFTVLHTPGHTPGGICLLSDEHEILISGDTLFAGTYGRVDLPGAEPDLMVESLHRLATLSPTLTVHPGHGPATTIAAERDWIANL